MEQKRWYFEKFISVFVCTLPQNILICVLQYKENYTDLERGWINDDIIYIFRCPIPLTYQNCPCSIIDVYFLNIGGAVMLLVYEYVSGWLQKNWWSSALSIPSQVDQTQCHDCSSKNNTTNRIQNHSSSDMWHVDSPLQMLCNSTVTPWILTFQVLFIYNRTTTETSESYLSTCLHIL